MPIGADKIRFYKELDREIKLPVTKGKTIIPVGDRRYIQFDLQYKEVVDLFSKIKVLN